MIRGPYNANKHSSYVELVIVVDNKISKAYSGNIKNIHKHCQDIANIVNAVSIHVSHLKTQTNSIFSSYMCH